MHPHVVAAAVALTLCASTQHVDAYAKYMKLMPNGADIPDAPACGHPDAAGMEGLNDFGKAFKKAGNAWTTALCQADTDGDGFTNGQEMGDPCCTWTPTNTGSLITDGISHPSDKTKTPTNEKLKTGCAAAGASGTSTTTGGTSGATGTSNSTATGGTTGGTTGGINDVMAPVSATKSPTSSTTVEDDDEDDSSESAVLTSASSAAVSAHAAADLSTLTASVVLVVASALAAAF